MCEFNWLIFINFLLSVLFQLGGIAMVMLGVSILYKYDVVLDEIKESRVEVVPIVFIAIGSAIFLIAFFGCCGAIFESECMILTVSTIKYMQVQLIHTTMPYALQMFAVWCNLSNLSWDKTFCGQTKQIILLLNEIVHFAF